MKKLFFLPFFALLLTGCTPSVEVKPEVVSSCSYENYAYRIGEIFPASDGVNSCECRANGTVDCTNQEVATNPAQCEIAKDCEVLDLETFCDKGSWSCVDQLCEYACDLNGMIE